MRVSFGKGNAFSGNVSVEEFHLAGGKLICLPSLLMLDGGDPFVVNTSLRATVLISAKFSVKLTSAQLQTREHSRCSKINGSHIEMELRPMCS